MFNVVFNLTLLFQFVGVAKRGAAQTKRAE